MNEHSRLQEVKIRIIKQLQKEAKEAEEESDRIGSFDREGCFEFSGIQQGLERAIEIINEIIL